MGLRFSSLHQGDTKIAPLRGSLIQALLEHGQGRAALEELSSVDASELLQGDVCLQYCEALWIAREVERLKTHLGELKATASAWSLEHAIACLYEARVLSAAGSYAECARLLDPWQHEVRCETLPSKLTAFMLVYAARAWIRLRDAGRARSLLRRAILYFENSGEALAAASALDLLGITERMAADWRIAEACHSKAARRATELGDLKLLCACATNLGVVRLFSGHFIGAEASLKWAIAVASEVNDVSTTARLHRLMALLRTRLGSFDEARDRFLDALRFTARTRDRRSHSLFCEYIGELRLAQGLHARARRWLSRGYRLASRVPEPDVMGECQRMLAEVELQGGNVDAAIQMASSALRAFQAHDDKYEIATTQRVLGAVFLRKGLIADAVTNLTEAIAFFEGADEQFEIFRAQALLSSARGEFGRDAVAMQLSGGRLNDPVGAKRRAAAQIGALGASGLASDETPTTPSADVWDVPRTLDGANGHSARTRMNGSMHKARPRSTGASVVLFGERPSQELERAANPGFPGLVGSSRALITALHAVRAVAGTHDNVLVQGETGTGKELIARAVHALSRRSSGRFVPVNCGAIGAELLDAEIFGHRRGAFTGATDERAGLARTASEGTLFLDEIAELSLRSQPRLLRLLDSGEVRSVGSDLPVRVDVRVVAATHQPIIDRVRDGSFRRDLYHRLATHTIVLPSLRNRLDDLPVLIEHLAREIRAQGRPFAGVATSVLRRMYDYDWPGNVRELRNAVSMLATRLSSEHIAWDWVPPRSEDPREGASIGGDEINRALRLYSGNIEAAAFSLGLSKQRLYRLCDRLGIDYRSFRKS